MVSGWIIAAGAALAVTLFAVGIVGLGILEWATEPKP